MQANATARRPGGGPHLRLAGSPATTTPPAPRAEAVWVDERNPILRRGIAACVLAAGYRVAGESTRLSPVPDFSRASMLIFDADAIGVARASAIARASDVRLIGLLRQPPHEDLGDRLAAGLLLRTLTPARLVSCIQAVGGAGTPARRAGFGPAARATTAPGAELTAREVEVLRLLAAGDSTRDIATRLSYSERTVKNIVHDVLAKLGGRTRAHAVALAVRDGVI